MRQVDRAFLIEIGRGKGQTSGTRFCDVPECTQTTREGKPYCPDHVDHHPYVQDILSFLATQEDEQDTAKRESNRLKLNPNAKLRDFVDVEGPTVQAIIQQLEQNGTRTMERLAREINTDEDVLRIFVRALVRAKLVRLGFTKRGSDTVRLAPKPESAQKNKRTNKHPT